MYEKNLNMVLALIFIKALRHHVTSTFMTVRHNMAILMHCEPILYRQMLLSIYVAQWFTNTQILSSNTAGTFSFSCTAGKKNVNPFPNKIDFWGSLLRRTHAKYPYL